MQVFVVTGAARGIGLEYVRQLLARGDKVHAAVRTPSDALLALQATAPDRCRVHTLDLLRPDAIRPFAAAVAAEERHVDVLVNNAGIYSLHSKAWNPETTGFAALNAEDLAAVFQVNAIAPLLLVQAFADLLAAAPRGRVANLSSLLGSVSHKQSGSDYAYCASKAALNIMTRALAVDLAPRGIIAWAMTPGWVRTDMGGPEAMLSPEESVRGQLQVIDGITPKDAGRFVDQAGVDQPF